MGIEIMKYSTVKCTRNRLHEKVLTLTILFVVIVSYPFFFAKKSTVKTWTQNPLHGKVLTLTILSLVVVSYPYIFPKEIDR